MKKSLAILLALFLLALSLTGCGMGKLARMANEAKNAAGQEQQGSRQEQEQPAQEPSVSVGAGAESPAESYSKYIEIKGAAYERLNAKLEENEELYMSMALTLLPVSMVDLTLIPLTFLTADEQAAAAGLAILGMNDVVINKSGGGYTITYADSEGGKIVQTCVYDKATDSMQSSITDADGAETLFFESVRVGDGYASQYFTKNGDGTFTKITSFCDKSSIAAFGMESINSKPASIFKNSALTVDFVKNGETYLILNGNTLTVFENGSEKTY